MKKEKCFDLGTIQAFIDGELASERSESVIKHIALCDACAILLTEAQEENAFAFSALDEGLNCLVPTERLRTKVFESIQEIERKEKIGWLQKISGGLGLTDGFNFKSPSLLAFASVVLFVSVMGIGVALYEPMPDSGAVATVNTVNVQDAIDVSDRKVEFVEPTQNNDDDEQDKDDETIDKVVPPKIIKAVAAKQNRNNYIKASNVRSSKINSTRNTKRVSSNNINNDSEQPDRLITPTLAEESGYLATISTLKKSVDLNKDYTLRPTERIAYERDMAVVDDAIKKMKQEVRKNPQNAAAREVLRSSYQNKIDLLNSVAEKTELMASIQ